MLIALCGGYALGIATWAWCTKREPQMPKATLVVEYIDPFAQDSTYRKDRK